MHIPVAGLAMHAMAESYHFWTRRRGQGPFHQVSQPAEQPFLINLALQTQPRQQLGPKAVS